VTSRAVPHSDIGCFLGPWPDGPIVTSCGLSSLTKVLCRFSGLASYAGEIARKKTAFERAILPLIHGRLGLDMPYLLKVPLASFSFEIQPSIQCDRRAFLEIPFA
jgi:hypothetical protein